MNNYAVARTFERIADLMEIKGENPFKVRAYRQASQTMQELTESLEVLAERGDLKGIPGVGDAIASKTRDILATGTTGLLDELRGEIPESLIELLALPGFGVKKVQAVWRGLDVRTPADLLRAAQQQKLRTLPGFTARTEATLQEAITAHWRRLREEPVGIALPDTESLVEEMLGSGAFSRVELVGALRRRKDTVPMRTLLAVAADLERLPAELRTHNAPGDRDLVRLVTRTGGSVTAWLCTDARFGQYLALLTGSEAHVEHLRARAAARGRSLDTDDWGTTEEEVYAQLGLPWIPPEMREDRGEFDVAEAGSLPRLVKSGDYRGCLHAHTTWSDGLADVGAMAEAARRLGYAYHAVTDHSKALTVARGLDEARVLAQQQEIASLNAGFADGFRVLSGIECDILADGTLDLSLEVLDRLDVVVASVHLHRKQDEATMTARIVRALESGVVDILGHPTGRLLGARDPYPLDVERVIRAAIANQVALEINAYPDRLDLDDVWARRAHELGAVLSINPDAHRPEHLALLRHGMGQARRAWLTPEAVINCWPPDRLFDWLRHRRE